MPNNNLRIEDGTIRMDPQFRTATISFNLRLGCDANKKLVSLLMNPVK